MGKWIASLLLLLCCSVQSASGQVIADTIWHANGFRNFDIHLPPVWAPGEKLPLVFNLHYLGGDARDQDTLTDFNTIADTAGFILCHPWGQGTNWNAGFNVPYSIGADDVGFISALIDTINALYNIDLGRVYAVGMGQGGFMAQRLACELDDRMAAVASVGGALSDSSMYFCSNTRPVPIMLVNGTADSVINYFNGSPGFWQPIDSLVDFWINRNQCTVPATFTALPDLVSEGSTINAYQYTCGPQSELLLYQVNNGGFAWPGATDSLPNSGIINQDINCSDEVWKFFLRFRLPDSLVGAEDPVFEEPEITLWPNPVSGVLQVRTETAVQSYSISNSGAVVISSSSVQGPQEQFSIDLHSLPAGMYFLTIRTRKGIATRKIIVQ